MLHLRLQLGEHRYALPADQIAEVLPLRRVQPMPRAPAGIVGVLAWRGVLVPVADLSQLLLGRPAELRSSTRIVVVTVAVPAGPARLIGLVAEKATATCQHEPDDFVESGIAGHLRPHREAVLTDAEGLVHRMDVGRLLPPDVRDALFLSAEEAG
jgi:chemotaxis-related protein WspB